MLSEATDGKRKGVRIITVLILLSSFLPAHQACFLPHSLSSWGARTRGVLGLLFPMWKYAMKWEAWQEDMKLFSSRKVRAQSQNRILLSKLYGLKIFVSAFFSMYICFKSITPSLNPIFNIALVLSLCCAPTECVPCYGNCWAQRVTNAPQPPKRKKPFVQSFWGWPKPGLVALGSSLPLGYKTQKCLGTISGQEGISASLSQVFRELKVSPGIWKVLEVLINSCWDTLIQWFSTRGSSIPEGTLPYGQEFLISWYSTMPRTGPEQRIPPQRQQCQGWESWDPIWRTEAGWGGPWGRAGRRSSRGCAGRVPAVSCSEIRREPGLSVLRLSSKVLPSGGVRSPRSPREHPVRKRHLAPLVLVSNCTSEARSFSPSLSSPLLPPLAPQVGCCREQQKSRVGKWWGRPPPIPSPVGWGALTSPQRWWMEKLSAKRVSEVPT